MDTTQQSKFDELFEFYEAGARGENEGLPMGFNKLENFIGIRKGVYTLIMGATGSGKSAFLHDAYILNPIDWYIQNQSAKVRPKIILFSMERGEKYILSKWLARRIFKDHGVTIPIRRMVGWRHSVDPLSAKEKDLISKYKEYINFIYNDILYFHQGGYSSANIFRIVKKYAEDNGKFEKINEYKTIYIPNDNRDLVIVAADHAGITKVLKSQSNKKEAIDEVSDHFQYFRDELYFSPVMVSQLNRELSSVHYQKFDSFEPSLDHAKETGSPAEDCDIALSLFDPIRYKTKDADDIKYDLDRFINPETGNNHFRSIKILKNSYGEADVRVGMAFWGACGMFKELPRAKDMQTFDYKGLLDGTYFKI